MNKLYKVELKTKKMSNFDTITKKENLQSRSDS